MVCKTSYDSDSTSGNQQGKVVRAASFRENARLTHLLFPLDCGTKGPRID